MAKGFKHGAGGGTSLNFKVVGNPKPAAPKENTLWVDTDEKITSWVFGADQPAGAEGMVWFPSGTASRAPFNAVKENSLMVYPSTAKQYVNGAWVAKSAQTYQGGKWVPWWDGVLYNRGTIDQFTTGGYTFWGGDSDCYCWSEGNGIKMYNSTYSTSYLVFNNRIDLTGVSKLQLVFDSVNTEYDGTTVYLIIGSNKSTSINVLGQASRTKSSSSEVMSGTLTIDTSKIDGGYVYVKFYTTGNYNKGYFYIREVKAVLA